MEKKMKNKKIIICFILALAVLFGACNDPVFYTVSVEPPIADPLISGSPTNFVVFKNKIYVASGRSVYSYDGKKWDLMSSQPGGRILQLAATDNHLYALCLESSADYTTLKRTDDSTAWKEITGDTGDYNMLQSIYAAGNELFIGAEGSGYYIILYMDGDGFKPLITGGTGTKTGALLCGAAYNGSNYYLCTRSDTIYVAQQPVAFGTTVPMSTKGDITFAGIINIGINDIIVAISRDGNMYYIDSSITRVPSVSLGGRPATGSLAVWRDADKTPRLLLAGRQDRLDYSVDSGYTYGYLELELDSTGIKARKNFTEPGKAPPSSVDDNERYVSTIGKNPVNYIFQTPHEINAEMTLFASTQKSGVWSYRIRDGLWQWNAEE